MSSISPLKNIIITTSEDGLDINNIDSLLSLSYGNILSCKYGRTNKDKLIDNSILKYVNNGYIGGAEIDLSSIYSFISNSAFVLNYGMLDKPIYLIDKALENCKTLTSVFKIPAYYKKIGKYAFSGCNKLSSVNLHKNITILGEGSFSGCSALRDIDIMNVTTIYKYGLSGTGISSINMNSEINYIPSYFFKDCVNLQKFENTNIQYLGQGAFAGCSSLSSVIIDFRGEYIDPDEEETPIDDEEEPGGDTPTPNPHVDPGVYIVRNMSGNNDLFKLTGDEGVELRDRLLELGVIVLYDDSEDWAWFYKYTDSITFEVWDKNKVEKLYDTTKFDELTNWVASGIDGQKEKNTIINNFDLMKLPIPNFKVVNGEYNYNVFQYTLNCYEVWAELSPGSLSPGPVYYIFDSVEWNESDYNFLSNRLRISQESDEENFVLNQYKNYECYIDKNYKITEDNKYPCYEVGWHKFGVTTVEGETIYASQVDIDTFISRLIRIDAVYCQRDSTTNPTYEKMYCFLNESTTLNDTIDTNNNGNSGMPVSNNGGTYVPDYLFSGCISLSEDNISFMPMVINVGESSFAYCRKLSKLDNEFKSIGNNAFKNCINLTKVDLSKCTNIGNYAFKNCTNLIGMLNDEINEFEINLERITSTNSKGVFENCKSLRSIKLNNSITTINEWFFKGCMRLENLNISNFTEVKKYGLYDCQKMELDANNNIHNITKFGDYSFGNCTLINNLIFNNSVKFGEGVFSNCISIEKINLNEITDKKITKNLFYNCSKLEELNILDSIDEFDLSALSKCDSLKKIHIEDPSGRFITYNDKCIVDTGENRDECKIIYVCKNIDTFELNESICETPAIVEIDDHAFDNSRVSLITLNLVPNIRTNIFKGISNGTYHVLLDKSHAYYNDYYSILGKNHIYYI